MDDESLGQLLRQTLQERRDGESFTVSADALRRRIGGRPRTIVGAAMLVGALVAAAGLIATVRPGMQPGATVHPSARPSVPNVIGLSAAEAETRLAAAGYRLDIFAGEIPGPDDAVLRQSPLPGWGDFKHGLVRVTFVWSDVFGQPRTLTASTASSAVSIALQRAEAEGLRGAVVVEVQPHPEPDAEKGERCEPGRCALVHINSGEGGASVSVEPGRGEPVLGFAWYPTTPWPPGWVFADEELVAAALADPQVAAAVVGKKFTAGVLSGGTFGSAKGPPCELPNGVVTCLTVVLEARNEAPGLVSVNFVTLEVRLDRKPGEETISPSAPPPVPNVIGLSPAEAETRLAAAGYTLETPPNEMPGIEEAVLRQSPWAGWGDFANGIVRVSFTSPDGYGGTLTFPGANASSAITAALLRVGAERPGPAFVVAIEPYVEDGKGNRCQPGLCAYVRVNRGDAGATVAVDFRRRNPVFDIGWQTTPFPPSSVYTEDELVAAALADPQVVSIAKGRQLHGAVKGGGSTDPPCRLPNGVSTCATIVIEVPNEPVVLVSVNFVTLAVRFDGRGE